MKKCIIIPDSFKGSLSSVEICNIAKETIPSVFPDCEIVSIPIADGGEGTVDCFVAATGAERVFMQAEGPFGEPVTASYARKGSDAVIEMAQAAGIMLAKDHPDPVKAGTFGVGEMIRDAVEKGCRHILIGIGGSASNDGGCGCAAALGVKFFDKDGHTFVPVGGTLGDIDTIDCMEAREFLNGVRLTVMCDVDNPLYGPNGAAYVFAPQKGADPETVRFLDDQLKRFDQVLQKELGQSVAEIPGTGAAGGIGAGLKAFFNAELISGIEAFLNMTGFDDKLDHADYVITGEGRIDFQSLQGKVLSGVAARTSRRNIPLIAIVGGIDKSAGKAYESGVTAIFSINRKPLSFEESAPFSKENYKDTLYDVMRLIQAAE